MLAGLGFTPFLRRRHLPAGQHRAGGLRLHRHSHHHAGRHHRPAARPPERRRGPHLRAGFADRAGLPDSGDVRLERPAGVFPAAAVCGVAFAGTQFVVSNFVNAQLTDILASMAAMGALLALFRSGTCRDGPASASWPQHRAIALAWAPYAVAGGLRAAVGLQAVPDAAQLHEHAGPLARAAQHILRMPPVVTKPSPYPAVYNFSWLSASGTACLFAAILGADRRGAEAARSSSAWSATRPGNWRSPN